MSSLIGWSTLGAFSGYWLSAAIHVNDLFAVTAFFLLLWSVSKIVLILAAMAERSLRRRAERESPSSVNYIRRDP